MPYGRCDFVASLAFLRSLFHLDCGVFYKKKSNKPPRRTVVFILSCLPSSSSLRPQALPPTALALTFTLFNYSVSYCLVLVFFLRYWSIKSLGNAFTRGIDAKQDMVLSSKGPYQLLRHPLYVGLALIVFGFALFMQSPIAMMMSVSLFPFALWVRIRKEESALHLTLKGRYDQWKKKNAG